MSDDWRPSGIGDWDVHGVCCYFDGCRVGERGSATHEKVRHGGIIVADDVLWDGKVADPQVKPDAQTKGILDFNEMVQADSRVENILLPVRHGLMIVRKV